METVVIAFLNTALILLGKSKHSRQVKIEKKTPKNDINGTANCLQKKNFDS